MDLLTDREWNLIREYIEEEAREARRSERG
jgi:hypothetical protein